MIAEAETIEFKQQTLNEYNKTIMLLMWIVENFNKIK